ncbi:MarR family winged helix-turn-helix transcriptional regulator [Paracoccus sp. (in: a-proteobacteria)]|uniref:MarR family winged helix-turn-helix transcriptional regulator n=1 Tax=Paracoccus sp. TaxID=267 RepID=UPI003A88C237
MDSENGRRQDETRVWIQVLRIHGRIFGELNRSMLEKTGISVTKFDALAQLYRYPEGLTMSALSQALRVTNGNVSGLVARLIRDGLVVRHMSSTDRRSFTACMTPKGKHTFEQALTVHDAVLAECLGQLSPEKLHAAAGLLREVSACLRPTKEPQEDADDHLARRPA